MTHKQKTLLAKRLSGLQKGYFNSPEWKNHVVSVNKKVLKTEAKQKELARKRKEKINNTHKTSVVRREKK